MLISTRPPKIIGSLPSVAGHSVLRGQWRSGVWVDGVRVGGVRLGVAGGLRGDEGLDDEAEGEALGAVALEAEALGLGHDGRAEERGRIHGGIHALKK